MDKQRLLELAGVPVTESINPDKEYVAATYKFKDIENLMKGYLLDAIEDGDYPKGSVINVTDEIAEKWAAGMGDALMNFAGERVVDTELELTDAALKKMLGGKK